jgi:hypothetical protein
MFLKSKTVDDVMKVFTTALEDLATVQAQHRSTASELDAKAEDLKSRAMDHHDEADRASAVASKLRKLLE